MRFHGEQTVLGRRLLLIAVAAWVPSCLFGDLEKGSISNGSAGRGEAGAGGEESSSRTGGASGGIDVVPGAVGGGAGRTALGRGGGPGGVGGQPNTNQAGEGGGSGSAGSGDQPHAGGVGTGGGNSGGASVAAAGSSGSLGLAGSGGQAGHGADTASGGLLGSAGHAELGGQAGSSGSAGIAGQSGSSGSAGFGGQTGSSGGAGFGGQSGHAGSGGVSGHGGEGEVGGGSGQAGGGAGGEGGRPPVCAAPPPVLSCMGADALRFECEVDVPVHGDFDGNGYDDIAIYRPPGDPSDTGLWAWKEDPEGYGGLHQWYGPVGQIPVPGDYDGDGTTDLTVVNPPTMLWVAKHPATLEVTSSFVFGEPGDVPVPADYDGDGATEPGVWRPGCPGVWSVGIPSTISFTSFSVEVSGGIPLAGNFDGEPGDEVALFDPGDATWRVWSTDGSLISEQIWGAPGDIPVAGDFDGDGRHDLAVWEPDAHGFSVRPSGSPDDTVVVPMDPDADVPAPGRYLSSANSATLLASYSTTQTTWTVADLTGTVLLVTAWGLPPGDPLRDVPSP